MVNILPNGGSLKSIFSTMNDYAILSLYHSSDESIKKQIQVYYFTKYNYALQKWSRRYVTNIQSMDDNLQECFFSLCNALDKCKLELIKEPDKFLMWIWIKNRVRGYLASQKNQWYVRRQITTALSIDHKTEEDQTGIIIPDRINLEEDFMDDSNIKLVRKYLNTEVSPSIREMFIQTIYEQKSNAVIAKERNCSKESIRKTLIKYKKDMKIFLINHPEFNYDVAV